MKWEYNPVDKSKRRVCYCEYQVEIFLTLP